jgi:dTDP-4-dehydrorhamnose reductase
MIPGADDNGGSPFYAATGAYGLVGRALFHPFPGLAVLDARPRPAELGTGGPALPAVDITDSAAVEEAFQAIGRLRRDRPLVFFHLAALTDTRDGREDMMERVNVTGTENVFRAALAAGAAFIHISTDYVFSAESRVGAPYTEDDRPSSPPSQPYAGSKFRAENFILDADAPRTAVVRIAFPYGGREPRPGLAEKLADRFEAARRDKSAVRLFEDQSICPSYIPDVARGLKAVADRLAGGGPARRVYHLTGPRTTPLEFGRWVREAFGYADVPVEPSSVAGTGYATNLWLSNALTSQALSWAPTPHREALRESFAAALRN